MDATTFETKVFPVLTECGKLLEQIQASELLKSKSAIVLVESEGLFPDLVYAFHKLIHKFPQGNGVDLILHSYGGTIDAASAIASLCKTRCGSFRVIIPFMAKSAATLIALAANERFLTSSAQLGPIDPQVRHPEKQMWFPAHSIKEALAQVEETKDPFVKMSMADKLDPFLIGAYKDAISASTQYIEEIVESWDSKIDRKAIIDAFTSKYKSHGHPIDRSVLNSIGVTYTSIDEKTEQIIYDLHEKCVDTLDEYRNDGAIILTKDDYIFRSGDFKESGKFQAPTLPVAPSAPIPVSQNS